MVTMIQKPNNQHQPKNGVSVVDFEKHPLVTVHLA